MLRYYERDGGPPWLTHALAGIAVLDLGLTVEHARALLGPADALPLLSADSESR